MQPLVVLRTYFDAFPADVDRALLESHGFDVQLDGSHIASVLPLHTVATGGVRLLVRHEDRDEAERILAEARDAVPDDDAPPDDQPSPEAREVDADLRRAAASAMLGFMTCLGVGAIYASILLIRVDLTKASPRGRRMWWVANLFIALELVKCLALFGLIQGPSSSRP